MAAIAGDSIGAAADVTASFGAVALVAVAGACTFALVARRIAPVVGGPWALFLGALGLGVAWLIWIGDESASSTVGVGDFMFSAGVLLIAFGGITWDTRPSAGRRFERVAHVLDPGLPVAAILGSLGITAVAHGPRVMDLVSLSTVAVIVMSVGRQVHLYARAERAREAERVAGRRLADEIEERGLPCCRSSASPPARRSRRPPARCALRHSASTASSSRSSGPTGRTGPWCRSRSRDSGRRPRTWRACLSADRGRTFDRALAKAHGPGSPGKRTRVRITGRLRELGVRMTVNAPLRWNDAIIGDIGLGTSSPESAVSLGERLHTIEEFAVVVAALLGPAMAERDRVDVLRRSIERRPGRPGLPSRVPADRRSRDGRRWSGYEALTRFDSGTRPDQCFADAWSSAWARISSCRRWRRPWRRHRDFPMVVGSI